MFVRIIIIDKTKIQYTATKHIFEIHYLLIIIYVINIDNVSVSVLYTWMKIYYIKLFNLLCSIYVNLMLANIVKFLIWFGTVLYTLGQIIQLL